MIPREFHENINPETPHHETDKTHKNSDPHEMASGVDKEGI